MILALHPDREKSKQTRQEPDAATDFWLQEIPPEFLSATMQYTNTKGVQPTEPVWQAPTHFFNHQTHQRGQVSTPLTQVGVDVGMTDLVVLILPDCYVINSF